MGNVDKISSPISTFDLKVISGLRSDPDACDNGIPSSRVLCDPQGHPTRATHWYSKIHLWLQFTQPPYHTADVISRGYVSIGDAVSSFRS